METIVGETLLSSSVKTLLDKLVSSEFGENLYTRKLVSSKFVENFRSMKLDVSLLIELKNTLARVLMEHYESYDDAKENKVGIVEENTDEGSTVKEWLDLMRCAVFEVDNLFYQINTEALRYKVKEKYEILTATSQVLKNLSSPFKQFNRVTNSKLQKLIQRLQFLISTRQQMSVSKCQIVKHEFPTSSDESRIYGRETDKKKLKHLLLSTDADNSKIRIISIVGMGGIGKTTLAKLLYNDHDVKEKFELNLWADISQNFNLSKVIETILESIMSTQPLESVNTKRYDTRDLYAFHSDHLLLKLHQILRTKKFLLVLDDVWDAKSVDWIYRMMIFNAVETGSRIIITTRDDRVALSMQTFLFAHYLRPLEIKDCLSLVSRYAFGACNDQQLSYLEEIVKEIAKRCDGLPLAAVAVGTFLYAKLFPDVNYVQERKYIWQSTYDKVRVALRSSYRYLSTPLKRCFAYCSIFPKKFILQKKTVVQLWIAEGLVESSTGQKTLEKVGENYFDVLVSSSLIQRRSFDDLDANFEMHNCIHDLATWSSSPHKSVLNPSAFSTRLDEQNANERVHDFSYKRGLYDSFNKFEILYELKGLHTFLALPIEEQLPLCLLSNKVVHDLLPTMNQLSVLSLSNYKSITEVPNSIGNLLCLRYLNLSHTKIGRLPSETCKLYNLQFLLLAGCKRLTELPEDMGKLVNLRHLDVSDTALKEMPVQIAKLEDLQTLSDLVVSKHNDGLKIAELGKFPHLHGKLSISQLQNVNDPFEADQANMKMKEQIDELALEWDCDTTFPDSQIQSVVLEHLQPSTNLKSLTIKGYRGINFPNWLGDVLFSNMVYLKISNCHDCLRLPPLGQLGNLKELIIEGMHSILTIDTEFYGSDSSPSFQPFPSLETLHFKDMQEWEEWNFIGGTTTEFPSLKTLSLCKCPKLRERNILDKFPSIIELVFRECPLLVQLTLSLGHVFRQLMFPLNSLQKLTIDGFPSPMSFPLDGLPKTLKFLIISNCENLEFLPHEYLHNYTLLEELKISYSCNSMISFTLGALPVLKSLFIEGCKNLKSLLIAEDASQNSLSFLRSIKIWDCNELESFPSGGLPIPNLVYIAVWKCEKLCSLPDAMKTLTSLQEIEIDNLPNLQSFVIDDLPINLKELTVGFVGGIMWNTEPTWEHLTCLSVLRINGNDTVNTLMEPLLPPSLVTLRICGLNDKGIDGKWLQHLTSLQNLEIVNTPKLKSLPKKGLPSSLSVLSITRCPLLEASLRRKRGKEWRKIAHITSIIIDDELIT